MVRCGIEANSQILWQLQIISVKKVRCRAINNVFENKVIIGGKKRVTAQTRTETTVGQLLNGKKIDEERNPFEGCLGLVIGGRA